MPQSRAAWEKRRVELLAELRAKVFGRFPRETVPFDTQTSHNTGGWSAKYAEFKEVTFATEEGVRIRAQLNQPRNSHGETPLLVHVKRPGDSFYSSDFDERLPVLDRAFVLVVEPRFTEQLMSTAEYTDIERTAAWTGRTMASMQVWDTLRAIAWAVEEAKIPATKIVVYGRDDAGVVALYAALFDERVNALIMADPPASHWQRPALPNVLRVTDLPEAAAALAPRELIFLRAMPPGFETTDALLKRTGNAGSVRVAGSLAAGLGLAK